MSATAPLVERNPFQTSRPSPVIQKDIQEISTIISKQPKYSEADYEAAKQHVQELASKVILSLATKDDLRCAQIRMEELFECLTQAAVRDKQLKKLHEELKDAQSQERKLQIQHLKWQFDQEFSAYKVQSKMLLETFLRMQKLSQQYQSATGNQLLPDFHSELNLPCLTGPIGCRANTSTGKDQSPPPLIFRESFGI